MGRQSVARHVTAWDGPERIDWASEKQREAFRYGPCGVEGGGPLCLSGGFGSAKTYAACLKMMWIADTFAGSRLLVARKVWDDLRKTTMPTFFKLCRPEFYSKGKRSDSEKYLRMNNGSEVLWMHMDDPETENVIKGLEINAFFLDQAEEIEEGIFDTLSTRLGRWDRAQVPASVVERGGGLERWPWRNPVTGEAQVPTWATIACNPDDIYHWIYRKFHPDSEDHRAKTIPKLDTATMGEILDAEGRVEMTSYRELGYRMIQMRSYENKFLPKHNLQLMMQRDESWRRRYIDGEWGILEGTIHVVSPLSVLETGEAEGGVKTDGEELLRWIRETCRLHRVLDHGDSAPTSCVWFAVDGSGNVFCYREYYRRDRLISDHRQGVYELSLGEKYGLNLADPSIFFKTQRTRGGKWSVADEYGDVRISRETALHWSPGDNNELGTRNRIGEYLAVDPDRVHPITKEKGAPRLFFVTASDGYSDGVRNLLKETRAQRREQTGTMNGRPTFSDDRAHQIPDHAYDCLRYFIASRPAAAKKPSSPAPANTFESVGRRLDEFSRKGGFRMMAREARRRYAHARA